MNMKKVSVFLLSGLLLAACDPQEEETTEAPTETEEEATETEEPEEVEEDPEEESSQNIESYLPAQEDTLFIYDVEVEEGMEISRYFQFVDEQTAQMATHGYENVNVSILEYREDAIVQVFEREETFFKENFLETGFPSDTEEQAILQLPIEEGNAWEGVEGSEFEITGVDVPIETASGSYEAVEVTQTQEETTSVYYYAEDVGIVGVSTTPVSEGGELAQSLSEIQENAAETIDVNVYTLNEEATGLVSGSVTLELFTNEPQREALTEVLQGNTDAEPIQSFPLFTENAQFNSLYIDAEGVIHADLNQAFVDEMNAGSGIESLMLQGLVNTLYDLYLDPQLPIEGVLLTVDGDPYESGHVALEEGELWEADDDIVE